METEKRDGATLTRKSFSATELLNAVEHGVNRELKFYLSLSKTTLSQIRQVAVEEALTKVDSDWTYDEVIAVCRSVVRRLLRELANTSPLQPVESEEQGNDAYGCNGQLAAASLVRPPARPMNRNWVEDEAIARIDTLAALRKSADHLGRTSWEWFVGYALASRKPNEASERMKFSRTKKRLRQL